MTMIFISSQAKMRSPRSANVTPGSEHWIGFTRTICLRHRGTSAVEEESAATRAVDPAEDEDAALLEVLLEGFSLVLFQGLAATN